MNSIHDLGGMHGMGPVIIRPNEPVFAEDWERRVFGTTLLLVISGLCSIDECRHATERIEPVHYLSSSYYQLWLDSLEKLLIEKGLLTATEVEAGRADVATADVTRETFKVPPDIIPGVIFTSQPVARSNPDPPKFKTGEVVRAQNINPRTHTRLPRYVRGHLGRIMGLNETFSFPDTNAHGLGENPQHVYSVRFEGTELWGPDAGPRDAVYIDLWESYLEAS